MQLLWCNSRPASTLWITSPPLLNRSPRHRGGTLWPMPSYLEQSLAKIEAFEGSIPWMYRDTVGKVTVGVGTMLPDAAAAQRLAFQLAGRPAGTQEIQSDFERVDALPMGRAALFYRQAGRPELPKPDIDELLRTVLTTMESTLRAHLTGYDAFPDGVKMALLDMAYNLGVEGLLTGYPRLIHCVQAADWPGAAAASFRHGPGAARNAWTRQMFLGSVVKTVHAVGEGWLKRLGYGIVGCVASWLG